MHDDDKAPYLLVLKLCLVCANHYAYLLGSKVIFNKKVLKNFTPTLKTDYYSFGHVVLLYAT